MNELSLIEKPAMELYAPGAIRSILDSIKENVKKTVIDPTTDKGRKEIASLAFKVAKTKVALDEAGKKLTEDARAQIDAVNVERKIVRDELDALKEEVRRPLTEYEDREKARVTKHQAVIARIAAIEAERITDEKRAANKRHREKILAEVAKDMNELVISSCIGEDIAQAIADGKIRHAYLQF